MSTKKSRTGLFNLQGLKKMVALITGSLFLVSVNPTLANGAHGSVPPPTLPHHALPAQAPLPVVPVVPSLPQQVHNFFSAPPTVPSGAYQMDLSATTANIVLGTNLFNGTSSVSVNVGGTRQSFHAGASVTPAEYLAIQEVLQSGRQTLVLSSGGAAIGGQFSVNQATSQPTGNLVVPQGVTGVQILNSNNTAQIGGALDNFGKLYDVSTNRNVNTGIFLADSITNEAGAVISTRLPAAMLQQFTGAVPHVDLVLGALNGITNYGTISSSGSLLLATLNGSINNAGGAAIGAQSDVNLMTGGVLNNYGTIGSLTGDINISTATPVDLTINATGGIFQALAGNINVTSRDNTNLTLNGGNYFSQNLNLYAGTGDIEGSVDSVTGVVNSLAGVEHFTASTNTLTLGNNIVTGDPTYVNLAGNIVIDGTLGDSGDANLAVIASGNITATSAGKIDTTGNAGNVYLIAGATLGSTGLSTGTTTDPPFQSSTPSQVTAGTVDVTFAPGTGGDVDLSGSTAATTIKTQGGAVNILAFNNAGTGGHINVPSIDTSNTAVGGNGGAVTLIAGANDASGTVTTGTVTTAGGASSTSSNANSGTGGAVTVITANPQTVSAGVMHFDQTGTPSGDSIDTNTADYTVNTSAKASLGTINTSGAGGVGGAAGGANGTAGGNAGAIAVAAGTVSAANLLAFGGGGGGASAAGCCPSTVFAGGAGGNGGAISVTSSNNITVTGSVISAGGGGGGGSGVSDACCANFPGGAGGAGGTGAALTLQGTTVSVTGAVAASDGGAGGAGGSLQGGCCLSGGGGGGASFGGGGGGGVGGYYFGLSGGGGAGYFGGGGAGGYYGGGSSAGGGGGFNGGGTAGITACCYSNGQAGSSGAGGNAGGNCCAGSPGAGGLTVSGIPQSGGGGAGASTSGVPDGYNGGSIKTSGGSLSITAGSGGLTTGSMGGGTVVVTSGAGITGGAVVGNSISISSGSSGNISLGNIQAAGTVQVSTPNGSGGSITVGGVDTFGSVQLTADPTSNASTITVGGDINTSGIGAAAGAISAVGGNGTNASTIAVSAGSDISLSGNLLAFGGGGGGGGAQSTCCPNNGTGFAGGNGGNGAAISVVSTTGGISITGDVNSSGGGGGGGGAANTCCIPLAGGAGGAGGSAGAITLLTGNGALSVTGSILAANGGAGGAGSNNALPANCCPAIGGGGGGASFGGGGGGGVGFSGPSGGGGAGYFGGGGGGGWPGNNESGGGGGGGHTGGGAGGINLCCGNPGGNGGLGFGGDGGATFNGSAGLGGNHSGNTNLYGTGGSGGSTGTIGANGGLMPGFAGAGSTASDNGDVSIQANNFTVNSGKMIFGRNVGFELTGTLTNNGTITGSRSTIFDLSQSGFGVVGTGTFNGGLMLLSNSSIDLNNFANGLSVFSPMFNITPGACLIAIAGGDVYSGAGGVKTIDTSSVNGDGGTVGMVAGAQWTWNVATPGDAQVTGFNPSGSVIFDGSSGTTSFAINTSSTGGNGGAVVLIGPGSVLLGTNSINSSSLHTGSAGGSVDIIAGAVPGSPSATITTGSITTGGSPGGNVTVATAQSGAGSFSNGTPSGFVPGAVSANAQIAIAGGINTSGVGGAGSLPVGTTGANGWSAGSVTVSAGSDVSIAGSVLSFGGGGGGGGSAPQITCCWSSASAFAGGNGGNGGAISITSAAGGIWTSGELNSSGGGGGGGGGASGCCISGSGGAGGLGGLGQSITVQASGTVSIGGPVLAADGGAGGAGNSNSVDCCGGFAGGGGASFGGGGGGGVGGEYMSLSGGGGAGFYGGGGGAGVPSNGTSGAGSGGGFNGGGAGGAWTNPCCGFPNATGQSGGLGYGGNAGFSYYSSSTSGLGGNNGTNTNLFGLGGSYPFCCPGPAGQNGGNIPSGSTTAGDVTLSGNTVAINGTLSTSITSVGGTFNPGTAFGSQSIYGHNITLNTASTFFPGNLTATNSTTINDPAPSGGGLIASTSSIDMSSFGGSLTFNGLNLAIVSSGNITNSGGAMTIDLSNTSGGNGGNLTLIAGFTAPTNTGLIPVLGTFTIGAASSGQINLPNVTIDTHSTTANGSGGNVFAMASNGVSLGSIDSSDTASGGIGGSVTVVGPTISVADINATGGAHSGSIVISSATAQASSPLKIVDGALFGGGEAKSGTIGGSVTVSGTLQAQNITLQAPLVTNSGSINTGAGGVLAVDNSNGNLSFSGSGTWNTNGGNIALSAYNTVNLGGLFDGSGNFMGSIAATNVIVVAGNGIIASGTPTNAGSIDVGSGGAANAGSLSMVAGANYGFDPFSPSSFGISGASGRTGGIDLTNDGTSSINVYIGATGTGGTNNGGSVNLIAYGTNGNVLLSTTSTVVNTGSFNAGGSLTVIAGATPASSQSTITLGNAYTGGQPGGNITLVTQQPTTIGGAPVVYSFTGTGQQSGAFQGDGNTIANAGISIGGDLNSSGFGGAGGGIGGSVGANGGNSGNITITSGSNIAVGGNLLAFGGGGGGGSSNSCCGTAVAYAGGNGGNGGTINVVSTTGSLSVTGVIDTSGGGGGGGAGANYCCSGASGGAGGLGGLSGSVTLSTATTLTSGGILAADGGNGGAGASNSGGNAGNGGGGGASFGGGGGGGVAGYYWAAGGGGGAGYYGGGGAGGSYGGGTSAGGSGGNFFSGGAGGSNSCCGLPGQNGGAFYGGNAGGDFYGTPGAGGNNWYNSNLFGVQGSGGVGASNGSNVPGYAGAPTTATQNGNITINAGGDVTLTSSTFFGQAMFGQNINVTTSGNFTTQSGGNITASNNVNVASQNATLNANTTAINGSITFDPGSFSNSGAMTAPGTITISGLTNQGPLSPAPAVPNFTNTGTIESTGGDVDISSVAGQNVVITGAGTIISDNGNVNITATDNGTNNANNQIIFAGNQTFSTPNGATNMFASGPNQCIWIQSTSNVSSADPINLYTDCLTLDGTLNGGPVTLICPTPNATIANAGGDVNLPSDFIFHGAELAILASGNINGTGITQIDLSGIGSDGGALTMVAGYNMVNVFGNAYRLGTPSPTGGSINLADVNINTSSDTGNGGNVVAVANGGSVKLGNIDTSAPVGQGGTVAIYGTGITVGNITTSGQLNPSNLTASGSVTLSSGAVQAQGHFVLGDCLVADPTGFTTTTAGGSVVAGNINTAGVGSTDNTVIGGSGGDINILAASTVTTGDLRTFGGGGAGGFCCGGFNGAPGGNGGNITILSQGNITIGGDLNTSGGGGGGGANGNNGGNGGNAGAITLNANVGGATGAVSITGPVLAAGGGGGSDGFSNAIGGCCGGGGGASFGGGGGGGDGSAGGGGFFGGGGTSNFGEGAGGGGLGGGAAGSAPSTAGTSGQGGNGDHGNLGGAFGVGGDGFSGGPSFGNPVYVGQAGIGSGGGAAGTGGVVTITGSSLTISNTIGTAGAAGVQGYNVPAISGSQWSGDSINVLGSTPGHVSIVTNSFNVAGNMNGGGVTISNTSGDLNLVSNVTAHGENVAILSVGNINGAGATAIDLRSTTGNGGTLNMLAGFNLSAPVAGVVTVGTPAAGGGAINLTNVDISAGTTFATGIAGAVNLNALGSVTVGGIDTTAPNTAGGGGSVNIIGNGVTTGNTTSALGISTTDSTAAGSVNIQSGLLSATPGIQFSQGTQLCCGSFSASSNSGNILLNNGVNADGGSLTLTTGGTGSIQTSAGLVLLLASSVNLTAGSGGIGSASNHLTPASFIGTQSITISTPGIAYLDPSAITTNLSGSAGQLNMDFRSANLNIGTLQTDNLTVVPFNTFAPGTITITGQVGSFSNAFSAAQNVSLETNNLIVNGGAGIIAQAIQITGTSSGSMTINNAGTLTTTTGNLDIASGVDQSLFVTGGGSMHTTSGLINLTATISSATDTANTVIEFQGNQDFYGTTNLNATGVNQCVVVDNGVTVTGHNTLNINSPCLDLNGTGTITGQPINFNSGTSGGTIANSTGDVNLVGGFIFHGLDLTILAAGNVNASSPLTIDLSSPVANGGNLTVIAGYDFTPSTSGQVGPTSTVFTLGAPSASGGSINLSGVDVTTASTGGNGGNVVLLAHDGFSNIGSIAIGNVNTTSSTGAAGNVTMFGQGGISTGDINTTGNTVGSVNLVAGTPTVTGAVQDWNGTINPSFTGLPAPVYSATPSALSGNINVGSITAPGATVTIITQGTAAITQTAGKVLTADTLLAVSGSGGIGTASNPFATNVNNLTLNGQDVGTSNTGNVNVTDSAANANLQNAGVPSFVTTGATGYQNIGSKFDLAMTNPVAGSITLTNAITGNTSVGLSASGAGTITQTFSGTSIFSPTVVLTTAGGNIGITGVQPIQLQSIGLGGNVNVTANAGTTGDVNLQTANGAVLEGANSGNNFSLNSGFGITIDTGATVFGQTSVTLSGFAIQQNGTATTITTPTLTLSTSFGNIGSSGQNLMVATQNLSTNTSGTGDVFITDDATSLALFGNNTVNNYLLNAPNADITQAAGNSIFANGTLTITGASLNNAGFINNFFGNSGNVLIDVGTGTVTNTGTIFAGSFANASTLTINAGNFVGDTGSFTASFGTTTINVGATGDITVENTGAGVPGRLESGSGIDLTAGTVHVLAGDITAAEVFGGALTINAGTTGGDTTASTSVTVATGASIAGNGLAVATQSFSNSGSVNGNFGGSGDLTINGGTSGGGTTILASTSVINNGSGSMNGDNVAIATAALTNNGSMAANNGNVTINGGSDNLGNITGATSVTTGSGSSMTATGDINIAAATVDSNGSINATGNLTINGGNSVINGTLASTDVHFETGSNTQGATIAITTGTLEVDDLVQSNAGSITIAASGDVTVSSPGQVFGATDVTISAADLLNSGEINASGALNLTATAVKNQAPTADLSGTNGVNITASTVDNNGSIDSALGAVNMNDGIVGGLVVPMTSFTNEATGTVSSNDMSIATQSLNNMAGASISADGNLQITGLNSNGLIGTGLLQASSSLTVTVNGSLDIAPLLKQTAGQLVGVDLVIMANGDINNSNIGSIAGLPTAIDTSSTVGDGGSVTIVSGAAFNVTGLHSVVLTGGSNTGGSINFTTQALSINTSSTNGNGGDVNLIAIRGSGPATAGTISFVDDAFPSQPTPPTSPTSIVTSGTTGSGNVTVAASGVNSTLEHLVNLTPVAGSAITVGDITTTGGANDATVKVVNTNQPVNLFNLPITFSNGTGNAAFSPNLLPAHLLNGSVVVGQVATDNGVTGSGSVEVVTNGSVAISTVQSHNINIQATNSPLFLAQSTINATQDASGNGGNITLIGGAILLPTGNTSPLFLNAAGANNGGNVFFEKNSTTVLVIGDNVPGDLKMDISGSTGNAGTVNVRNGGDIFVAMKQIGSTLPGLKMTAGGNGADVKFVAGTIGPGKLTVVGNLNVSSANGVGGTLDLESNSSTVFNVTNLASTNVNGVQGLLNVSGTTSNGSVFVTNNGGSVSYTLAKGDTTDLTKASAVSFTANGKAATVTVGAPIGDGTGTIQLDNTATSGTGAVNVKALVKGSTIDVVSDISGTATAGNIALTNALNAGAAAGTVNLTASGKGTITESGKNSITTFALNVFGGSGSVGGAGGLLTDATDVSVNGGGAVSIKDSLTSFVHIFGATTGSTFTFKSAGSIDVDDSVFAPKSVTIASTGANGSIQLDAPVSSNLPAGKNVGGTITLTATGTGTITDNWQDHTVQAGIVNLNSGSGSIGLLGSPVFTTTANLSTTTTGNVFVTNETVAATPTLTLTKANSAGTFDLTSDGNVVVKAALPKVVHATFDVTGNGNLTLNGAVGNATTTLDVSALIGGTGNLTGTGTLTANSITLNVNTGNIGTAKAAMKVVTTSASGALDLESNTGLVNVKDTGKTLALLNTNSHAGTNFTLATSGSTTINNLAANNGSISIVEAGGVLKVNAGSQVIATNGTILLENSNTSTGTIVIGDQAIGGTVIETTGATGGQIAISIGAVPKTPVVGPLPGAAIVSPVGTGQIFFGSKGITVGSTISPIVDRFDAINTNLIFNAGTSASKISVFNARITADPPAPTPALTVPSIAQPASTTSLLQSTQPSNAPAATIRTDSVSNSNAVATPSGMTTALTQLAGQSTAARSIESLWISETELSNGEIPAVLQAGAAVDIKSPVSTIVDMHAANGGNAKAVSLNKGSVVFAPKADTTVHTAYGDIKIAAHSVVLVIAFSGGVGIYDLDDAHSNSVCANVGSRTIAMHPGTSVVLTDSRARTFDDINPAQLILYRNINEQQLGSSMKAFVSEFMPLSAIHAVQPLRKLVNSKQSEAQRISEHLLKTAAIVTQTRATRGQYKQVLRPSVAAWAQ